MGATSPIAFLDQMVSFAVPVVIFVIALIVILIFQILCLVNVLKNTLYMIIPVILGLGGAISSFITMSYYAAWTEVYKVNLPYMSPTQVEMCPNIEFYSVACIFFAVLFAGSIFFTTMIAIIKKVLANR
ncbi:MAG: hypothetical protein GX241_04325 [Ruminococcaceae bacterium]|nr:hypothetical protein [Oscillospiraceae bacterium]